MSYFNAALVGDLTHIWSVQVDSAEKFLLVAMTHAKMKARNAAPLVKRVHIGCVVVDGAKKLVVVAITNAAAI